jgi:uncharacterized protein (DUF924 family)
MSTTVSSPIEVLEFWWAAGADKWFQQDDAFDAECRETFLPMIQAAKVGELDTWPQTADGALALILLLDQLTRNVFRGTPEAFAADEKALGVARIAIEHRYDRAFPKDARGFFYLPFEHSEKMADQDMSVDLFRQLGVMSYYHYALIHMDVIRRFGRFPHRNAVLGRPSTDAEVAFLESGGFSA